MEVLQDINKAKLGDKDAYSRVINYYENKLYIIAKSRLSNNEDIKDVIQETIMYAYINIQSLKDANKFSSWITTILINNCNKLYSRNKVPLLSYDDIEAENMHFKQDNEYMMVEDNLNFFNIINSLELEEKTIITMYYLDEYTTREISQILNINESTLRSRISSIRNKIRTSIGKESNNDR